MLCEEFRKVEKKIYACLESKNRFNLQEAMSQLSMLIYKLENRTKIITELGLNGISEDPKFILTLLEF